jgi:hypothetical protein
LPPSHSDELLHVIWRNRLQWLRYLFLLILRPIFKRQLLIGFLLWLMENSKLKIQCDCVMCTSEIYDNSFFSFFFLKAKMEQKW